MLWFPSCKTLSHIVLEIETHGVRASPVFSFTTTLIITLDSNGRRIYCTCNVFFLLGVLCLCPADSSSEDVEHVVPELYRGVQ